MVLNLDIAVLRQLGKTCSEPRDAEEGLPALVVRRLRDKKKRSNSPRVKESSETLARHTTSA